MRFAVPAAAALAALAAPVPAPPASADTVLAAPHEQRDHTAEGHTLLVGHRSERVDRVATDPWGVRKAEVGNEFYASVGGGNTAGTSATLTIGYHVGCAVSVTGISAGIQQVITVLGLGAGTAAGLPKSTIVTVQPHADHPPTVKNATLLPGLEFRPKLAVTMAVGSVADIPLATAAVRDRRATVRIDATAIEVEGCLGPVSIRSYAVLAHRTARADDTVRVYGDPIVL